MGSSEQVGFDSDGISVIVDNFDNSHICSEEIFLTDKIDPIISNGVATIGGRCLIPKGIGIGHLPPIVATPLEIMGSIL